MRVLTRTKVALGAVGLVLAVALQGLSASHAATDPASGGTIVQFGTDQTLTTSSTGVTTTQAFPGGGTSAACFIQATTSSGVQTITSGNCTGITLTVTCASNPIPASNPTADVHGAAI